MSVNCCKVWRRGRIGGRRGGLWPPAGERSSPVGAICGRPLGESSGLVGFDRPAQRAPTEVIRRFRCRGGLWPPARGILRPYGVWRAGAARPDRSLIGGFAVGAACGRPLGESSGLMGFGGPAQRAPTGVYPRFRCRGDLWSPARGILRPCGVWRASAALPYVAGKNHSRMSK